MSYQKVIKDDYILYLNKKGKDISVSGTSVIEQDGFVFKDLEGVGELLPYEDWRLESEVRAEDLLNRLTVEEMLGLTIHTSSQNVPALPNTMLNPGTYGGKEFDESGAKPWELTDQQKKMMVEEGIRHFLVSGHKDVKTGVKWTNQLQRLAESLPHGIPVNISSDPRHGAGDGEVEYKNAGMGVSRWPEGIGMAATASPELCKEFAKVIAKEYRALGITTMLGPQIDLATEPRWMRMADTFGADSELTAAIAKAYCDGLQTTEDTEDGWGKDSVMAMAKHWPGGGTGESGRDAHYPFGKYAVYPGSNFEEHLKPFLNGAMKLEGKTQKCAAIMPYYNIPWNQDQVHGENVGNAYSEYIIKDLLIEKYGYDGVICTDWNIAQDKTPEIGMYVMGGKCHGVEGLSEEERFLKLMINGVNQFGGIDTAEYVKKAYERGCKKFERRSLSNIELMSAEADKVCKFEKSVMEKHLRLSAYKLLLNLFRLNLFEQPYVDIEESLTTVGCMDYVKAGYEAQLKSVVLLKNKNQILPAAPKQKVYIPNRHISEHYGFVRFKEGAKDIQPVSEALLGRYFECVEIPEEADLAIVFADSPIGDNGFEPEDSENGESGYRPISLQYRPYTAVHARKESIAGGDPREAGMNRSYYGKQAITANESDLDNVIHTKERMKDKPVIVCIRMKNPAVMAELEPFADVILVEFGVQKKALLDIITGVREPCGKLPMCLPKNMETVERHMEDVATDIEAYTDTEGHTYDMGYGITKCGGV